MPCGTKARAPTMLSEPMTASSINTAFMPIRAIGSRHGRRARSPRGRCGHALSKTHVFPWKDMDNAVFLDVGSRFHGDSPPVPPQNRAWANVDIGPDPHISRNIGLRMNKGRGVDDGSEPVEFEKHVRCVQGSGHSLGPRRCTWSPGRSGLFGGAILAQRPKQCARRSYPRGDQGRWRRRLD